MVAGCVDVSLRICRVVHSQQLWRDTLDTFQDFSCPDLLVCQMKLHGDFFGEGGGGLELGCIFYVCMMLLLNVGYTRKGTTFACY